MEKEIIVSTDNKNKIKEIKNILEPLNFKVKSKSDIGLSSLEVVEDGKTLEENSYKKAEVLMAGRNSFIIADDSGLFVDALNGKPGVYSSRYAGEKARDNDNNDKILRDMKDIPWEDRTASFKTVICLITPKGEHFFLEGRCDGRIGLEPVGTNGFGYDPIFIPNNYKETFGELSPEVKNRISHRYRALKKLLNKLRELENR